MTSKHKWLIGLVIILAASLFFTLKPDNSVPFPIPPAMKGDEITACPDSQLLTKVLSDLRYKVNSQPNHIEHWRNMADPARHVLALSWVEDDLPADAPSHQFSGFAILMCNHSPNIATLDEIAAAYEAIGAPKTAEAVKEAKAIAESPEGRETYASGNPQPHFTNGNPFDKVDRKFRDQRQQDGSLNLLRKYIRAHADDIASARMN